MPHCFLLLLFFFVFFCNSANDLSSVCTALESASHVGEFINNSVFCPFTVMVGSKCRLEYNLCLFCADCEIIVITCL